MKAFVLAVVLAGCAAEADRPIMAPPDVLARMKPNADTSHNPTLWSSSTGGCDGPSESGPTFGGCQPGGFREGCGSPRGGGRGRAGGLVVLAALALALRRRR